MRSSTRSWWELSVLAGPSNEGTLQKRGKERAFEGSKDGREAMKIELTILLAQTTSAHSKRHQLYHVLLRSIIVPPSGPPSSLPPPYEVAHFLPSLVRPSASGSSNLHRPFAPPPLPNATPALPPPLGALPPPFPSPSLALTAHLPPLNPHAPVPRLFLGLPFESRGQTGGVGEQEVCDRRARGGTVYFRLQDVVSEDVEGGDGGGEGIATCGL